MRSGNNAIITAARSEESRRVRAPDRGRGRRRDKVRGRKSAKDHIAIERPFWQIEKFIIRQPPIGEKDDYDSENSWISDGLPSSSRRRRRGDGRWGGGEWREK